MHSENLRYPEVHRDENVTETLHDISIPDPYRWLEDSYSEETKKFVDAQNAVTFPFLKKSPVYDNIKTKLTNLWDYPKQGCPFKRGSRFFHFFNSGLQNQSVMYVRDSWEGESRVLIDPNTWSADGTVALSTYSLSEDGEILAYGVSSGGSDWVTINFLYVATGEKLKDELKNVKFTSLSWTHDNKGIFYNCYPSQEGVTDGTETTSNLNQKLMYHYLGQEQSADILCYHVPLHPTFTIGAEVTDCGNYIIVTVFDGCEPNHLMYFCDLRTLPNGGRIEGELPLVAVVESFEAVFSYITNTENIFVFRSNLNAPMYKLITVDFSHPQDRSLWKDLIPTDESTLLEWGTVVNHNDLIVCHLKDVKNVLSVYHLQSGEKVCELPLELGTILELRAKRYHTTAFMKFASFLTPGIIYSCDFTKRPLELKTEMETKVGNLNMNDFMVEQIFYESKDKTRIPMFIVRPKSVALDGSAPCLLYGYGGFDISLTPSFGSTRLLWLQHFRGVYAVANLRGGGEYGKRWHDSGRLMQKQNVFNDFQCAMECLVEKKYTNVNKLAIMGGSNGGLLVGACILQRPDLCKAAIAQVGVLDMLRFHKFTIGHAWISDYGSPDEAEQFKYLLRYSPLHNVKTPTSEKNAYPALMLLTADHDDRVVPLHSMKFIAEMQHKCRDSDFQCNPLLIRVECKAGHGAGKPTSKAIEEYRDVFAFLQLTLDLKWYEGNEGDSS